MDDKTTRLHEILRTMQIPPDRFDDLNWLNRNMCIKNDKHPDFKEALNLIRSLWIVKYGTAEV